MEKSQGTNLEPQKLFQGLVLTLTSNSQYLNGISLTRGNLTEQIWSFPAGVTTLNDTFGCPCVTSTVSVMSSFVG